MSKAKTFRTRRHRHQAKQAMKFGNSAKPSHRLQSGRTGHAFTKKLKSRHG